MADKISEKVESSDNRGGNYLDEGRYTNPEDLRARYGEVKGRNATEQSWKNIVCQYERKPYHYEDGSVRPSLGQLRGQVDQALATYVDFATERREWAKIETFEGKSDAENDNWGRSISAAFQRHCIKNWKRRQFEIIAAAKDMLLFTNGPIGWKDRDCVYPSSIPAETVWPDDESGQFPEDWDVLFIEERMSAIELYRKVEDEQSASDAGWDREAVLSILKSECDWEDDSTLEAIFAEMRAPDCDASKHDRVISLVTAYVREYQPDEETGNEISKFVFSDVGETPTKGERARVRYLLQSRHSIKSMDRVIGIFSHSVARRYYDTGSFAQTIYAACYEYDILFHSVLEGVADNMRVYLESSSPEEARKLMSARVGNYQILEPGITLKQDRVVRPIKDAAEVARLTMIEAAQISAQYRVGENTQGGGSKTATQSEIDIQESSRISSSYLKVFNLFLGFVISEVYRRFVTCAEGDPAYKGLQRFKKELRAKKVPDSAWDPDNVRVESPMVLAAGSMAAKIQGSRIVLDALAVPAKTPGEHLAKRDIVAAVVGSDAADLYLPEDENFNIPQDALIGLENEALLNAKLNPANIQVSKDHFHMRHVPAHLGMMDHTIRIAEGLFQNMGGMMKEQEPIIETQIGDMLIALDNMGAHVRAHLQFISLSKNRNKQAEAERFSVVLGDLNKRQDRLQGALEQKVAAKAKNPGDDQAELSHKQRLYQMEQEHRQKMIELDYVEKGAKAEQLRNQSAANAQQKQALEVAKAQNEIGIKQAKAQTDRIIERQKSPKPQSTDGKTT